MQPATFPPEVEANNLAGFLTRGSPYFPAFSALANGDSDFIPSYSSGCCNGIEPFSLLPKNLAPFPYSTNNKYNKKILLVNGKIRQDQIYKPSSVSIIIYLVL